MQQENEPIQEKFELLKNSRKQINKENILTENSVPPLQQYYRKASYSLTGKAINSLTGHAIYNLLYFTALQKTQYTQSYGKNKRRYYRISNLEPYRRSNLQQFRRTGRLIFGYHRFSPTSPGGNEGAYRSGLPLQAHRRLRMEEKQHNNTNKQQFKTVKKLDF